MQITQAQIYNKYTQTNNAQYTFYTTTSHNMCYQTFFYAGNVLFYTFRRSAACLARLSFPQTINVQHLVIHIIINKMCINLLTLTYKTCTLYLVEKGLLHLARATLMHAVVRFFLHDVRVVIWRSFENVAANSIGTNRHMKPRALYRRGWAWC